MRNPKMISSGYFKDSSVTNAATTAAESSSLRERLQARPQRYAHVRAYWANSGLASTS